MSQKNSSKTEEDSTFKSSLALYWARYSRSKINFLNHPLVRTMIPLMRNRMQICFVFAMNSAANQIMGKLLPFKKFLWETDTAVFTSWKTGPSIKQVRLLGNCYYFNIIIHPFTTFVFNFSKYDWVSPMSWYMLNVLWCDIVIMCKKKKLKRHKRLFYAKIILAMCLRTGFSD